MKRKTVLIILEVCFVVLSIICTVNELYGLAIFPFIAMIVMYFVVEKASGDKFKGISTLVRHVIVLSSATYIVWFGVNSKLTGSVMGILFLGFVIVILAVIWEKLS